MTKKEIENLVKRIEKRMKEVAAARDKLDVDIDQFNMLRQNCDEAHDCLQRARDALSEMV